MVVLYFSFLEFHKYLHSVLQMNQFSRGIFFHLEFHKLLHSVLEMNQSSRGSLEIISLLSL